MTAPAMSKASPMVSARREAVERVIAHMHERFHEPLSLCELAEVARFSPYHFHRVFNALTGMPPARFLSAIRLEEAKRLLLTGDRSITDICMSVGYSSLGTFSARFHGSVGVPPSHLRRLAQDPTLVPTVVSALSDTVVSALSDPAVSALSDPAVSALSDPAVSARGHGAPPTPAGSASVHGEVHSEAETGPIFVGLFRTCSPERAPVGCAVIAGPGRFSMKPVPAGSYHILATSFGPTGDALGLLLPERSAVLVSRHRNPLRLGHASAFVDLHLRRPTSIDPPLLLAPPALLATEDDRAEAAVPAGGDAAGARGSDRPRASLLG